MDFDKNIELIEKKLGYAFRDKSLLRQAFTRSSYCNEHRGKGGVKYISNEVLEFFGDSVLSTVIIGLLLEERTARYEYGIRTELNEGDFTAIRSKLSDKHNLSASMAELGLHKLLIMSEGDKKLGIENEPSVMEDLFESIVGAIYIDSGKSIARTSEVVREILDLSTYSQPTASTQSPKNLLQEWCADKKHRLPPPIYKTVSESGPDHKRVYERGCYIGDELIAVGSGKNQKLADTAAATKALEVLQKRAAPPVKTASPEAVGRLKAYAASKKLPTPEFRDLGESISSSEHTKKFVIECRFAGRCETAAAPSKQEARALAAEKLLEEIRLAEAPAKHPEKKKLAASKEETREAVKRSVKHSQKTAAPTTQMTRSTSPKKAPHYHKKRS